MALPLPPQVFAILSHLIEDSLGLHFDARDADVLSEKLSPRAEELGLDSLLDYYYFLRYDSAGPRELDAAADLLVVNETYFYREASQLRALVELLLPRLLESRSRARIWCAACASGEEPFTLAMMLRERGLADHVDLVASDISGRALAKAREGVYGGRSLRALPPEARSRHFVELDRGLVRVCDAVRQAVAWQRLNLFDVERVAALGLFDVILCRNALIYFRDETVVGLVDRFGAMLRGRGTLLVGASESLLRFGTAFDCEEHGGTFFYRKREAQ